MNLLVALALFGWVPLSIYFFFTSQSHRAVLYVVIGGMLFLPTTGYNLPGLPEYSKYTAIALGLLLGGRLSGSRRKHSYKWSVCDVPMLIWCICPFFTSLSNQLGIYDGLSASLDNVMTWGIPYFAGRIYFYNSKTLQDLCTGIVIGGLLYLPLCLYEIRMSPQLNNIIYGFFPHSWGQHLRYGGFRPIVFMQHGLMVALWMALSTTVLFWMWRSKYISHFSWVPASWFLIAMITTTILCKSVNGIFFLVAGVTCYYLLIKFQFKGILYLLMAAVPLYIFFRISNIISSESITNFLAQYLDPDRIESLTVRLHQENLFMEKTLQRPLLGWGGWGRGWPIDPARGVRIGMIDSMWLIAFNGKGFLGLGSLICAMLIGPLVSLKCKYLLRSGHPVSILPVMLCLIVVLFMVDSLMNGMINLVYIVCSGALVGWYTQERRHVDEKNIANDPA